MDDNDNKKKKLEELTMSNAWCWSCIHYDGGDGCYAGRDPEENTGLCIGYEDDD